MKKKTYNDFVDGFSDHKSKVKQKLTNERKKKKNHRSIEEYYDMYESEKY